MAIVNLVKWTPGSDPVYAWRYPETNLSTFTQLIVAESQEALLFSKGRIIGKFGPGKHTLDTENIPVLRNLFGIPFGGNNPFTAEVWFVNKLMPLNIDWDTDNMRFNDPDYKTMVPLMARGRYGLQITDAERFLIKLVGTATSFSAGTLTDNFRGTLVSKTKSIILQAMQSNNIGVKSIGAHLDILSQELQKSMLPFWEGYGFNLVGFYVTSIDIDTSTTEGKQILEAMGQQSAQSIAGYTWQQKEAFKLGKDALSGSGGDMGILGVMMMSGGLMGGNGAAGKAMMEPQMPSANTPRDGLAKNNTQTPVVRDVFCSKCSKKFQNSMRFCPHCGDPYLACPRCGTDNDEKAIRCVSCGQHLNSVAPMANTGDPCARCKNIIAPNTKFCPSCGLKVS